jgi:hypothetical protein
VRPTSPWVLAVVFVVGGIIGGFGLDALYNSLPELSQGSVVTVGIVALLVAFLAWTTHNRLTGQRGAKPPEPLVIARYVALARACSPAGALVAGLWAGALGFLLTRPGDIVAVSHDRRVAIGGVVTAVLLAAAGLWLEWVCRIRDDHDDHRAERVRR